jgi:hypothetical protein
MKHRAGPNLAPEEHPKERGPVEQRNVVHLAQAVQTEHGSLIGHVGKHLAVPRLARSIQDRTSQQEGCHLVPCW